MAAPITGNMTWAEIRKAFLEASGQTTAARQETYAHLTQGFRLVVQDADVPEVFGEATVIIPEDPLSPGDFQDHFEVDANVYAIESVMNLTISAPVYFEPSGMRGRDRYVDANPDIPTTESSDVFDEPKPPPGQVRWYRRVGQRFYVRDTPDRMTKLRIRYRIQVDPITVENLNDHPFLPPHLDWAIVWKSAANYYKAHRDENIRADGNLNSMYYDQQAEMSLKQPKNVDGEEEKDSFHRMRVAGYRIAPRSRRSGGY